MQMQLAAILVMGLLALICGISLVISKKKFAIQESNKQSDEVDKISKVRAVLPGSNCGACGLAGCDAFAQSVVAGKVLINGCKVGGQEVARQIAEILK